MFKTIALIFVSILLSVCGQFMLKLGVNSSGKNLFDIHNLITSIWGVITTPFIFFGFLSYGLSAVVWLLILSRTELSFAYPFMGLSFVLIAIVSGIFLGEHVSTVRWAGILVIVFGVFLISRS